MSHERRPDLDFLRVAAILLLHLYHCARFFNVDDPWHLKAPELIPALNLPMDVLTLLRMPMLMLIAGVVAAYAIQRRGVGGFAWERTRRLLFPLIFGILVVVPPQIYVDRVDHGQFAGSYWSFWPSVLQGVPYPKGNTSWHHLWFVGYLFVFCLLALPLFAWWRRPSGKIFLARAEAFLLRGWNLLLLVGPIWAIRILLRNYVEFHDLVHDPKGFLFYFYLFLAGSLLGRCPALWDRMAALRWSFLALALSLWIPLLPDGEFPFPFEHMAVWMASWTTLLACFGFVRHRVRRAGPRLQHLQSLAYPFYILHQTVILVLGWPLMKVDLGPWTRFGVVTLLSFAATWMLCEILARVGWLRPCFGMPWKKRQDPEAVPAPA